MTKIKSAVVLLYFLGLSFLVSLSGMLYHPGLWYERLGKPSWTPPNSVFPIAWTILYIFMALAAWLVSQKSQTIWNKALRYHYMQLVANFLWSLIVFGQHRLLLGVADILFLEILILVCCVYFWEHSKIATCLMIPYAFWVTYAASINIGLYQINPFWP